MLMLAVTIDDQTCTRCFDVRVLSATRDVGYDWLCLGVAFVDSA